MSLVTSATSTISKLFNTDSFGTQRKRDIDQIGERWKSKCARNGRSRRGTEKQAQKFILHDYICNSVDDRSVSGNKFNHNDSPVPVSQLRLTSINSSYSLIFSCTRFDGLVNLLLHDGWFQCKQRKSTRVSNQVSKEDG